jgi:hypothetical protein
MNIVSWIVQGGLAAVYLLAGAPKTVAPIAALSKRVDWIGSVPAGLVRFIGVAEVLGATGLVLPVLTGILPWLTVAAAAGLMVLQVCAALFHVARSEVTSLPVNGVLLALALLVVVERVFIVPVA